MIDPFDHAEIKHLTGILLNNIFDESGRGAILIATSHVEDHLTKLIEVTLPKGISNNHKNKLLKYPGPLSSFSAKIELAYVFRLINKNLYDSLNSLRKIRNDAAHNPSKFELHELNERLKSVYNLGDGVSNFIKKISTEMIIRKKNALLKNILKNQVFLLRTKRQKLKKYFRTKSILKLLSDRFLFGN